MSRDSETSGDPQRDTHDHENGSDWRTALKIWAGILGGLALQIAGLWLRTEGIPLFSDNWWVIVVVGSALYLWGCCILASSKGYSKAWGLLGLTSCVGLVVLISFPRLKDAPPGSVDYSLTIYQRNAVVGLPLGMVAVFAAWVGAAWSHFTGPSGSGYYLAFICVCYIASIWGSFYLALRKGRHLLWAFPSVLTIPGWLLLFLLPDKYKREHTELHYSLKQFQRGMVGCIGFFAFLFVLQLPMYISYNRAACDRTASTDLAKLAKVLQSMSQEATELNCDSKSVPSDFLEYLTGPYYGWQGTNRKCEVLVRIEDEAICACSPRGSRPHMDEKEKRYIYRVNLRTGEQLQTIIGPCTGKSYGGPETMCYEESIFGSDCTFRKPRGRPCKEIQQ